MAFLEVKHIKKAFGDTKVLHGIDFAMERGQVTVVIGSLAFFLFLQGIRDAGPVRASILSVGEPLVAALLGVVWLGDSFSLMQLVGFTAILAIVFLLAKDE